MELKVSRVRVTACFMRSRREKAIGSSLAEALWGHLAPATPLPPFSAKVGRNKELGLDLGVLGWRGWE
jgi:hypothetical protein